MKCLVLVLFAVLLLGCTDTLPTEPATQEGELGIVAEVDARASVAKGPMLADIQLWFNTGYFANPSSPNYYGTFRVEGEEYGIITHHLGSGKPFGDDNLRGNAFFAYDRVDVYSWIDFDPDTQELNVGDHLMTMYDKLVFRWKQSTAVSQGRVAEAYGDFAPWVGRPTTSHSYFVWADSGLPLYSIGTYKVR